jgi:PAS domain S-box-containing protein
MRLPRGVTDAGRDPDPRSGSLAHLAIVGGAVVATACGAVALAIALAASLGVTAAVAVALGDVALVALAILQCPAPAALRRMSRRVELGFDDAAIGMVLLTLELRILRVNDALCALFARDAQQLLGRSILEFTHPDDVRRSVRWSRSRLEGNEEAPLDKRYIRPDGSIVDAAVVSLLIEPEDAEPYFFSQLQDVTEQRRAERQKAVIADLGRRAVESSDAVALMGEAMPVVRETLGTANCLTSRRLADGSIRLVAAAGETFDLIVAPGESSQSGYTLPATSLSSATICPVRHVSPRRRSFTKRACVAG